MHAIKPDKTLDCVGSFCPVPLIQTRKNIDSLVCEASKQMLGWDNVDLIPGVKIVGAGTLNDLALEAGSTLWF